MLVTDGENEPLPVDDHNPNCAEVAVTVALATSFPHIVWSTPVLISGVPLKIFTATSKLGPLHVTPFTVYDGVTV